MTLDDLRIFVRACDAGSLSAVAREVGTSQSAVSQHIRRLERELGVALFERGRRGVLPTAAGRVLLAAARDGLASLDGARRELDRMRSGDAGTLRLATGGTTLRHFMIGPLATFRRRHPAVTFEYVSATSTGECLDAVRQDRADLAYVTIGTDGTLQQRPAARTEWILVVATSDPLAGRRQVGPRDLATIRPIGMPASTRSRSQLEQQLSGHGVQLTFATTVNDWDTVVRLVELGVGQAIVPAMWVHDLADHPGLSVVPITGLAPITFGWAARDWEQLPAFTRAFAALVDEGIARLGPAARVLPVEAVEA